MGLRWYAARTAPGAELQAVRELSRDGFEIFFPRIKDPRPRIGHYYIPLFPGYLFLRCDPEREGWPLFRRAHRILGWVGFGGEVPCLPDDIMAEIKEKTERINQEGGLRRRFRTGDEVRIVSKSLHGLAQVVEDTKSSHARVKVLLRFMGRLVSAQVPREDLQPIEDQPLEKQRVPRRTRGRGRWIQPFGAPSPGSA